MSALVKMMLDFLYAYLFAAYFLAGWCGEHSAESKAKAMFNNILKTVNDAVASPDAANMLSSPVLVPEVDVAGKRLRLLKQLGQGGFAFVYLAEDVMSGKKYAVKKIIAQTHEQLESAEREMKIMQEFGQHPNFIGFYGHSKRAAQNGATEVFVLMELCEKGNLFSIMQKMGNARFAEKKICVIFEGICSAIQALHSANPPIAHRDIKVENILVTARDEYKLCDFGSCTTRAQVYQTRQEMGQEEDRIQRYSTLNYRAPEMCDLYRRERIDEKVDVWAMGCVLYALAFFRHPFEEGTLGILSGKFELPSHSFSPYLEALVKRLLTQSPAKRPSMKAVLELTKMWKYFLETGQKPPPLTKEIKEELTAQRAVADPHAAAAAPAAAAPNPTKKKTKKKPNPKKQAAAAAALPRAAAPAQPTLQQTPQTGGGGWADFDDDAPGEADHMGAVSDEEDSAAGGLLGSTARGEEEEQGWACSRCTYKNPALFLACKVCGSARDGDAAAAAASQRAGHSSRLHTRPVSQSTAHAKANAGQLAPPPAISFSSSSSSSSSFSSSSSSSSANRSQRDSSQEWVCQTCFMENAGSVDECDTCGSHWTPPPPKPVKIDPNDFSSFEVSPMASSKTQSVTRAGGGGGGAGGGGGGGGGSKQLVMHGRSPLHPNQQSVKASSSHPVSSHTKHLPHSSTSTQQTTRAKAPTATSRTQDVLGKDLGDAFAAVGLGGGAAAGGQSGRGGGAAGGQSGRAAQQRAAGGGGGAGRGDGWDDFSPAGAGTKVALAKSKDVWDEFASGAGDDPFAMPSAADASKKAGSKKKTQVRL
eukprot:g7135.t1